jgi:dephospho-CoA kinase
LAAAKARPVLSLKAKASLWWMPISPPAQWLSQALLADGRLNRAWLRQKVFADASERLWLESQTHPRIREAIIEQLRAASSAYAILASPLLFESKQVAFTQRSLVIDVPEAMQLLRASLRDGNDIEQIRRIMAAQLPRQERLAQADDVVDNSGSVQDLEQRLAALHHEYLRLAQQVRSSGN